MLHRLSGRHPGAASAAPAWPCHKRHLQTEPVRRLECMAKQYLPGFAHELDWARFDPDANFQVDGSAEAGLLHGGEVRVHALARQIAVHEEPIDPGTRIITRLNEIPHLFVCIGEREGVERNAHCGHANSC